MKAPASNTRVIGANLDVAPDDLVDEAERRLRKAKTIDDATAISDLARGAPTAAANEINRLVRLRVENLQAESRA